MTKPYIEYPDLYPTQATRDRLNTHDGWLGEHIARATNNHWLIKQHTGGWLEITGFDPAVNSAVQNHGGKNGPHNLDDKEIETFMTSKLYPVVTGTMLVPDGEFRRSATGTSGSSTPGSRIVSSSPTRTR